MNFTVVAYSMRSIALANTRTGLLLAGTVASIYVYTMYHLKSTAPGNLANLVSGKRKLFFFLYVAQGIRALTCDMCAQIGTTAAFRRGA